MVVEVGQAPWRPVFDVLIGSFSDQMLTLGDPIDHSNRNLILSVMAAFTTLKMRSICAGQELEGPEFNKPRRFPAAL